MMEQRMSADKGGQMALFESATVSAAAAAHVKKDSIETMIRVAAAIVHESQKEMPRMVFDIGMILVNPLEEERIRAAFLENGLAELEKKITPCRYVEKGKILVCKKEPPLHMLEFGDMKYDI